MKLHYIRIGAFKNLRDFECKFDAKSPNLVTVLLGRNGTGKSNLLEALVVIFGDLYLGEETNFDYELHYSLKSGARRVEVRNAPGHSSSQARFSFLVSETTDLQPKSFSVPRAALKGTHGQEFLPRHVFAYYSGPSDRLEQHFRKHQRNFYRDLLGGNDVPFRPLFYARPVHSNFVLLAFFTKRDPKGAEFLRERLRIVDLESVLFVLRKPTWKGPEDGDARFWKASGTVRSFLSRVYDHSFAPLLGLQGSISSGIGKPKRTQFSYLFLPSRTALEALEGLAGDPTAFFKELESTYISDLLSETRIRVAIQTCDDSLTFRELSEGEQQLLTVVGLLRFSKESEALFLLDEPDTHLNPAWAIEYLDILKEVAEPDSNSQILLATHEPLVVAGLSRDEVLLMERDPIDGTVAASHPTEDPRGLGVSGILRSSMFGLRTILDRPTQEKLDERFELVGKGNNRTAEENARLEELTKELSGAGFANDFRDTNFARFAQALAKVRYADRVVLNPEEVAEVEEEALRAVEQILAEERHRPTNQGDGDVKR